MAPKRCRAPGRGAARAAAVRAPAASRAGVHLVPAAPALAIFLLFRDDPAALELVLSFQFWSPMKPAELAGLYHYEEMLVYDDVFWTALKNTFVYMRPRRSRSLIALVLALLVDSRIRGRGVYRTIIFMSLSAHGGGGRASSGAGSTTSGSACSTTSLRSAGLIDEPIAFLETYSTAMPSVIAAAIWQIVGFFMIILLTGLQSIPPNLYEAASIDGASRFSQFWRITLPLLRPSIFLCFVIGIIASFTSFDLIYVMTNGGPGHATELLITYIYKAAFTLSQFDYAGALTMVMFVLFVGIALLANLLAGGEAGKVDMSE